MRKLSLFSFCSPRCPRNTPSAKHAEMRAHLLLGLPTERHRLQRDTGTKQIDFHSRQGSLAVALEMLFIEPCVLFTCLILYSCLCARVCVCACARVCVCVRMRSRKQREREVSPMSVDCPACWLRKAMLRVTGKTPNCTKDPRLVYLLHCLTFLFTKYLTQLFCIFAYYHILLYII